jgi:hypothetical protein
LKGSPALFPLSDRKALAAGYLSPKNVGSLAMLLAMHGAAAAEQLAKIMQKDKRHHDNSTNSAEDQYQHHPVLNVALSRLWTRHDCGLFSAADFLGSGHFVEITRKGVVQLLSTSPRHLTKRSI